MNYLSFVLFIVCFVDYSISLPDAPVITSIEQINENTVSIKWTTNSNDIKRYRLFYTEKIGSSLKEWPNQMEKIDDELEGTPLSRLKVSNTFECYISCIKNPECEFAEFRNLGDSLENCLLKSNVQDDVVDSDDLDGREFYKLKKYTEDEAIIRDLPPNNKYIFYLSVYDESSREWSVNSKPSKPFEIKIQLTIENEFYGDDMVKLTWQQAGKFKDYKLSRYNLKIWINGSETSKDFMVSDDIIKYDVLHDVYDLAYTSVLRNNINDGDSCFQECLNENVCIRYLYFYNDQKCYLLAKVNLLNSQYRSKNSELEGLLSYAKEFNVPFKLIANVNYKVVLEYKTIYGVYGTSNTLNFTLPEKIITDTVPATVGPDHDLEHSQAGISTTVPATVGPDHDLDHTKIVITTNVPASNPYIETDQYSLERFEGASETLTCKLFDSNSDVIVWSKLNSEEKLTDNILSADDHDYTKSELILNNLKRSDSGTYKCALKDDPSVFKEIVLTVNGAPAKPRIRNCLIRTDKSTYLSWDVEHLGGALNLRNVNTEYSTDFNDNTKIINNIETYWETKSSELDRNEITFEIRLKEYDQIRIQLETDYGKSEKSDTVRCRCEDPDNCLDVKAEEIKVIDETTLPAIDSPEPVQPNNKTTVILVALIAVIVFIIIVFIVYQNCCQKAKPTSKDDYHAVPKE